MSTRLKLVIAVGVLVALSVPALVIARSQGSTSSKVGLQSLYWNSDEITTNSKNWKTVPGFDELFAINPTAITVSIQPGSGKASYRLQTGPASAKPGAITSSGKGFESFTFVGLRDCEPTRLQWKKVGSARVVVKRATVTTTQADLGCG